MRQVSNVDTIDNFELSISFKLNCTLLSIMTSFYDNYDYYKKMLELQEKLRKR